MDPRLKAYQKQQQPPVVRSAQLPQFDPPLVKTVAPPKPEPPRPAATPGLFSGDRSLRKVAKFLILLGQDEAAKVVRHLDADQVEALSREIAGIKKIEPVEAEAILHEFGYIAGQQPAAKGGKAAAQAILHRAFGDEKAQKVLKKAVPGAVEPPFAFLADLEAEAVTALLGAESPQVLAVVVPFLAKDQAAAFLKQLPPPVRLDLVKRLAKMDQVPKSVVAQVEQGLKDRAHALSPGETEAVDGRSRLADILRHMDTGKEESILRSLGESRPEISEDLRKRLFTAADLLRIDDGGFEDLLRGMDDPRVALLWLAADEPLRTKIEANVSSRRLLLIKAEVDLQADTPARELKKELRYFVDEVRQAVREGRAALIDDSEEYV